MNNQTDHLNQTGEEILPSDETLEAAADGRKERYSTFLSNPFKPSCW